MLEERIFNDYVSAMKAKDALKSSALSFLRSALKNTAIDKKKDKLSDEEVIAVIKKQVKQRQDSIEQFKQGKRMDLADKEEKEMSVLRSYLPQELSPEELRRIIKEAVKSSGAASLGDMGRVMKEVMAKTGGAADGKIVSELVKDELQKK